MSCDSSGRPHYPPTEEVVLARSAYARAGGTFQHYLPHAEKAGALLGYGVVRKTKPAAKGPAGAGDRIGAPKPAMPGSLFDGISKSTNVADGFVQGRLVRWAFLYSANRSVFHWFAKCLQSGWAGSPSSKPWRSSARETVDRLLNYGGEQASQAFRAR